MTKLTKSQKRLFVILAIVLAYAAIDFMMNREDYAQTYSTTKAAVKPADTATRLITAAKNNVIKADQLAWGRDPFSRGIEKPKIRRRKAAPQVKLVLNAITYSGENSVAIINDEILQHGDMIEGYVVQKITADMVVLKNKDNTIQLKSR